MAISNDYYDAVGNRGSTASATFTVDTTGPAAPTFLPAHQATVTNAATNITLTFAEAVKKDANGTDFANSDLSGILTLKTGSSTGAAILYAASIDTAKKVVTLNPSSNLADGDVYVAISNDYYDAVGNRGSTASATFTVDTTGPAAPTFLPAHQATVTNAATNITLTFAEAVKKDGSNTDFANSDLSTILTLKKKNASGGDIAYTPTINSGKTKITINPDASLVDGAVYVAISNGYYDAAGNQGSTASATFTVDTTGPAAPTFLPAHQATVTNASTNITLTFAEAVKKDGSNTDFANSDLSTILTLKKKNASGGRHRLHAHHQLRQDQNHHQPRREPGRRRGLRGDQQRLLRRRGQPGLDGQRHLHGRHHRPDGAEVPAGAPGHGDQRGDQHHADLRRGR